MNKKIYAYIITLMIFIPTAIATIGYANNCNTNPEQKINTDSLEITKKIYDKTNFKWIDEIITEKNNMLSFKITIKYNNITDPQNSHFAKNIVITDKLPPCLEYIKGSTSPNEPNLYDNNKTLVWDPDITLHHGEFLEITFNTKVITDTDDNGEENYAEVKAFEHCTNTNMYNNTTAKITVKSIPPLEVDAGGPYRGNVGETINFNGTVKNGTKPYTYFWDFDDGNTSNTEDPTHIYTQAGTYKAIFRVTDSQPDTKNDIATVIINETQDIIPPEIKIIKPQKNYLYRYNTEIRRVITYTKIIGSIIIKFNVTDDDSGVQKVKLFIDDELKKEYTHGPYTYEWNDKYFLTRTHTIKIYAVDNANNENTSKLYVWKITRHPLFIMGGLITGVLLISSGTTTDSEPEETPEPDVNQKPEADANGPYFGIEKDIVTFDGSKSYDVDGEITSYTWDFGDETTGSGVTVDHTYDSPGSYDVILTVTDNDGAKNTDTTTATIQEAKSGGSNDDSNAWPLIAGAGAAGAGILGFAFWKRRKKK